MTFIIATHLYFGTLWRMAVRILSMDMLSQLSASPRFSVRYRRGSVAKRPELSTETLSAEIVEKQNGSFDC